MKKKLAAAVTVAGMALALFAAPVLAIPLETVGSEDVFVNAGNIANSNPDTEKGWIATVLGLDASTLTYTQLTGSGGEDGAWIDVTGESSGDLWAWDFGTSDPVYFLIKTGSNTGIDYLSSSGDVFNVFLYSNSNQTQYGVIDISDYFFTTITGGQNNPTVTVQEVDIFRVSHVGETGTTQVPEPGTLLLLGSGLLGLGLMRRRRD